MVSNVDSREFRCEDALRIRSCISWVEKYDKLFKQFTWFARKLFSFEGKQFRINIYWMIRTNDGNRLAGARGKRSLTWKKGGNAGP